MGTLSATAWRVEKTKKVRARAHSLTVVRFTLMWVVFCGSTADDSPTRFETNIGTENDEEDDETNRITVSTPIRDEDTSKDSFPRKPSDKMSPGNVDMKKMERKGNRVCLVTDLSKFDDLVKRGRNVVGVRRFNRSLIEIIQSERTKTHSNRVTIRTTKIPRDIKRLCGITEKDLKVNGNDVDLTPSVLRFTFSSKDKLPEDKKSLKDVCSKVFRTSIEGLMQSCIRAVERS